jgi:putative aldouronate transport system substrate-binding protein
VFVLAAAAAWGAGGTEGEPSTTPTTTTVEGNSWEVDTTPIKMKFFFDDTEDYSGWWGETWVTKTMIEDTGVDFEWIFAPDGSHNMLNLLIASGDLGDMIRVGANLPQIIDLAKNDQLHALNKLSEQYAPDFMAKVLKDYPHMYLKNRIEFDSMDLYRAGLYAIPYSKLNDPMVVKNMQSVQVIKEIWEEVGSPVTRSADDFLKMLRAVKNAHPDMIPAHPMRYGGVDNFGSPRIIQATYPNAGLAQKVLKVGDKYVLFWEHPSFLKLLKFVNTLYNEGLTNKDVLTEQTAELRQRIYAGKVFCQMNQDADNVGWFQSEIDKVYEESPHPQYTWMAMDPPYVIDPATMKYRGDSINGGAGGTGLVVPKTSRYPARAIRWISYIYSDYYQLMYSHGEEGKHYFINNRGYPQVLDSWLAELERDPNQIQPGKSGIGQPSHFRMDWFPRVKNIQEAERSAPNMAEALQVSGKYYEDFSLYNGAWNWPADSEESKIFSLVKEEYTKGVVNIIAGRPSNVETAYNEMIARMRKLGLDKLNNYMTSYVNGKQAMIDKYKAGLGL